MRSPAISVLLSLPLLSIAASAQVETVITPKVDSVCTFKNGVAMIRASFRVEKPGLYVWQRPPTAVQGTFWVESDLKVNVRSTVRMLPAPEGVPGIAAGFQQELAGKTVRVVLKAGGAAAPDTYEGRVWSPPPLVPIRAWDKDFASLLGRSSSSRYDYAYTSTPAYNIGAFPQPLPGQLGFLILEDERGGRQYIAADSIASISVQGRVAGKAPEQAAPILIFDIADAPKAPATIQISYLARGMAWVPSYRLELRDEEKLKIRAGAVVRNELIDLHDAEIRLISGYPAMPFAHVDSPLWANGTLANFFTQLGIQSGTGSGSLVIAQNITSNSMSGNDAGARGGAGAELKDENAAGVDMHFESIGHHTLAAGDSLSVEVASADCAYERVIDWSIKDRRDDDWRRRDEKNTDEDQPWEGIRFANPFRFPMTTGTAITLAGGDFRSQTTSYWMNPGQQATLRTGKALTLKTEVTEAEDESARKAVPIGSDSWLQRKIQTTLRMQNFRDHPAKVIVRAEYRGEFVSADGTPEKRMRVEKEHKMNLPRELEWTVVLPPKGERTIQFWSTFLTR